MAQCWEPGIEAKSQSALCSEGRCCGDWWLGWRGGKALRAQRLATGVIWVRDQGLPQNRGSGDGGKGKNMNKRAKDGAAGRGGDQTGVLRDCWVLRFQDLKKQRRDAGFRKKMVSVVSWCPKAILKMSVRHLSEAIVCKREVSARDTNADSHLHEGETAERS